MPALNLPRSHRTGRQAWRQAAVACAMLATAAGTPVAWAQPEAQRHNTVQFSATATQELVQDELTVLLEVVRDGSQAADVQSDLKRVLDAALSDARQAVTGAPADAVSLQTGGFQLYPRHASNGRIAGWQGRAQLVLSGRDAARVSQAAGKVGGMSIASVRYGLSRALRERHEAELTSQAIALFRSRASRMAADFGMRGYTLGQVAVSSTEPGFEGRPVMMAMAKAASVAADAPLPIEPGKGVLSVTVSGDVLLTP